MDSPLEYGIDKPRCFIRKTLHHLESQVTLTCSILTLEDDMDSRSQFQKLKGSINLDEFNCNPYESELHSVPTTQVLLLIDSVIFVD
jgi:hypothetical protein